MKLTIEKLIMGGRGLAFMDGRPVFVPFTVPGDIAEIEITKKHKDYDEGEVTDLITPSSDRAEPKCPVFGKCGGCQWQHVSYECQLKWKREIIKETWKRFAKIDVDVEEVIPSPKQWHYRNRIQLHTDNWGKVGFYAVGTHEVVNMEKCYIADEKLNEQLNAKREEMKYWRKGLGLKLDEEREGKGSFAQVNTLQNKNLKKLVGDLIEGLKVDTVLELYAGAGNLTFEIAGHARHVIANDIDKHAVRSGNERAKEEGVDNLEFVWGAAEKIIKNYKADVIILDPPRIGAKDTMDSIVEIKPSYVLYVSCDPTTLVRDSMKLLDAGYKIKRCQPIDMFPQTYHVETVTLFGF